MAGIFTEMNRRFTSGSILAKYIYINVGVYFLIQLIMLFMQLFQQEPVSALPHFLKYIQMPSSWQTLQSRPWTIFTYMFVHIDFWHILINMLGLYWFGKIFLRYFNGRQLSGLYVLGGLAGGALYSLSFHLFPYFRPVVDNSYLFGASASVMAIVFAVSFSQKDFSLNLFFLGRIKLMYIAVGFFLIDLFAITSSNAGGRIAHIGGSLLGVFFALQYLKGKDVTRFINRIIDFFINLFRRKPKFKVHRNKTYKAPPSQSRRPETDDAYLCRKKEEETAINNILDKLKHSGYESLTAEEKKRLFQASKS